MGMQETQYSQASLVSISSTWLVPLEALADGLPPKSSYGSALDGPLHKTLPEHANGSVCATVLVRKLIHLHPAHQ